MATKFYSAGERNRATRITHRAVMMEEAAAPQKRLNPHLAEVLANLTALRNIDQASVNKINRIAGACLIILFLLLWAVFLASLVWGCFWVGFLEQSLKIC